MNAAEAIIALGNELSEQKNAAFDLWTWLPSYKVAQKHHGDYADNETPSVKDILVEAAMYIAAVKDPSSPHGPKTAEVLRTNNIEETEWFERCPCGKDHIPDE
jgi:hypothetical protein